ncbi:hypothetical protein B0H10DRAFT_1958115 [Mycena sp. CBHHK59/15]|nr:hypothetical protein B0H10DRAFT_1958115 [Mycena sp. CBHHK59/15]
MEEDNENLQWGVPYTPHVLPTSGSSSVFTFSSYSSGASPFANTTPTTPSHSISHLNNLGTPFSFTPIQTLHSGITPEYGTKRRRESTVNLSTLNDENIPPTTSKRARTRKSSAPRQKPRSEPEKIQIILDTIKAQGWSLGEFLYNIFRLTGRDANRPQTHAQMVATFLGGRGMFKPSAILSCWMTSSDGVLLADSPHLANMYSMDTPYMDIGPIRPALTSFALQTVGKYFARRAEDAVNGKSGLHASVKNKDTTKALTWVQFSADTISDVCNIIDHHLSAAWYLMDKIATPYSTIHRNLKALSAEEAAVTFAHGSNPTKAGVLLFDNVQNLTRVRDLRIGRENHMNVGMSTLWVKAWPTIDVKVFDLEDKQKSIANNERASLTVDKLFSFLDQEDADTTGYLQWPEVLVRCMKPLNPQIPEVKARYRATAKLVIPLDKSIVHPLSPSGKKETIPSELKEGLLDFFAQVGQVPTDYLPQKLIVGGDGLSYAMLLQLQVYLQFHKDPFKSFEIVEPQLQVWHTKWMDLIRIYQTHWGRVSGKSTNPAALGHSAAKIGRTAPSNMKKMPGCWIAGHTSLSFEPNSPSDILLYNFRLILKTDDIFGYFDKLVAAKNLPDLDDLTEIAKKLHHTYSTARARDHAVFDTGSTSTWAKTIPKGSAWAPIEVEDSSLDKVKKKKTSTTKKKPKDMHPRAPCKGDFVLAQAMDFLCDALNSRKMATAVAEGDVGRLYECIKVQLIQTTWAMFLRRYLNFAIDLCVLIASSPQHACPPPPYRPTTLQAERVPAVAV